MANVCSRCSTENADGVLTCRQCGAALTPPAGWSRSLIPEDDTFDPLSAPTLVMQHTAPAALPDIEETQPMPPPGGTARRVVWGLASFVVVLGAGVWLLRPSAEPSVVSTVPAAAPASALALAAPASAADLAVPVAAPAPEPAPPASAAAAAVAVAQPAPTPAPASAVERRKRIPEPLIRRPVPASAPALPAAPVAEPAPAPSAPASAALPPEPARPRTVAELCAGSSLLTRPFCEHRECAKAEQAGDPVCVRLKEAEEARRVRQ